jgi:hypothetical protein
MEFLRKNRRLAVLGGMAAALAGATLLVVLPALASNPGDYVNPPSGAGVLPKDVAIGGTGDCANLFSGLSGVSEYDNVNPKTKTNLASGHNDNVTFGLTMHTQNNQAQTLDVTSSGAEILGIGIKGGTQSTAYDYRPGYVTSDSKLHAPLQSFTVSGGIETGTQFYSISQLTVCYRPLGSVSGIVYDDLDQNGTHSAGDTGLGGWTVNLYQGPSTTPAATATSAADGSYHMNVVFDGTSDYRLCESPPSGTWGQTEPAGSTASCGAGDLAKGWALTKPSPTQTISENFGNVAAIMCTTSPFGPANYQIGTCKPTQRYVFHSGILNGKPFVSYWVDDTSQTAVPTVEKITLADPIQNGQPQYRNFFYEDGAGFPVDASSLKQMQYCLLDPRSGEFGLNTIDPSSVLPAGETSCIISLRNYVDAAGNGWLEVYDYSLTDSIRSSG